MPWRRSRTCCRERTHGTRLELERSRRRPRTPGRTEIGTLAGRNPRSIVSGQPVPAGTSGGVSLIGTIASLGGALFIAAGAAIARWPVPFTAVVLGGLAGAMADSLLGATWQTRRWCDVCAKPTERPVHSCGNRTRRTGGLRGFDNDAVNAVCSGVGALVTLLLS